MRTQYIVRVSGGLGIVGTDHARGLALTDGIGLQRRHAPAHDEHGLAADAAPGVRISPIADTRFTLIADTVSR